MAALIDLALRLVCCQPVAFPERGRLSSQRPQPSTRIIGWLRITLFLLALQVVWAAAYTVIAFSRRWVMGMILNPGYVACACAGLLGCMMLDWRLLAVSISGSVFICVLFLAFVAANYAGAVRGEDPQAWVVLALFVPGLAVDLVIALLCLPLLRALVVAERAEPPSPSQADQPVPSAQPAELELNLSRPVPATQEEVADAQRVRTCPVCLDRAPDTVLIKCKHMVCNHCSTQLPDKKCPICRQKFSSTMKVFLG